MSASLPVNKIGEPEPSRDLLAYLRLLAGPSPAPGRFFDIRWTTGEQRMSRRFVPAQRTSEAAHLIGRLASRADVYVGVALSDGQRDGTKHAISGSHMLYIDRDHSGMQRDLAKFEYPPTMEVASGTPDHLHLYWRLHEHTPSQQVESANRRIARLLGGDPACVDVARILRPGTLNHKHDPPRPVSLVAYRPDAHYTLAELLSVLPALERSPARAERRAREHRRDDPLQRVKPAHYIRLLTGLAPGPDGKIACPFHPDSTPSLHVYDTPERGWACYGCPTPDGKPRGGDIYTLASMLWGIPSRGPGFIELRARLDDVFRVDRDAASRWRAPRASERGRPWGRAREPDRAQPQLDRGR
jgi:hypothetical protein